MMRAQLTSSSHKIRPWIVWAIAVALVLHGLIPLGFMPNLSAASGQTFALQICDGTAHHQDSDSDKKTASHQPCSFSINALFAWTGVAPSIAIEVFAQLIIMAMVAFTIARPRRFGIAPPRAPPQFS